jgi:polyisoprenoid-binding protein YceI
MSNWNIDTTHSHLAFEVRHMVFSKVRGEFGGWKATLTLGEGPDPLEGASVEVDVEIGSIDTKLADRDAHLRSADFFDVEAHGAARFTSRGFERLGDGRFRLLGELTLKGVTRELTLEGELLGTGKDPWGNERAGFHAEGEIDRRDFGLVWNVALETGGLLVGEKVRIVVDAEAVKVA